MTTHGETLVDVAAERAVLGQVLADGRLDDAARGLRPEDFGDVRHAAVFRACAALHAGGVRVDTLTLAERLRADGALQTAGGPGYLVALAGVAPLTGNAMAHVAIVRDRALRRALVARAEELLAEAHNLGSPPARVAHQAGTEFSQLAAAGAGEEDEMGSADVLALADAWDDFHAGRSSPFLPVGMDELDAVFRGFLPNLNLVGGRASMGKTAFVAQMAWGWLKQGLPGGIFGLEDGTRWLVERHCSRALGIDLGDVGACRLHDYQQEALQDFMGQAHDMLGRLLRVHRTSGLEAGDLLRKAERWIARGARWLVIDHGGRITHATAHAKERYDLGIRRTCEALDNLAHNTGVPIIVNWHFSREGAKREGSPTMEDFRESGYLEAFSGTMLGLWERPANPGMLLVTVVKNRKGPRDVHVALRRDARHGLVHATGGHPLDLLAEAQERETERAPRGRRQPLFTPQERAAGGMP
jgi:replicative DNA helicase